MARLQKLLSIRTRIIGDFDHHIEEIEKFSEEHSQNAVSFRALAFDKTFREYSDLLEELEKCHAYHELENIAELVQKNRLIQDKYLTAKLKISDLLPEHEVTLNDSFLPNTHKHFNETEEGLMTNNNNNGIRLPNIQLTPFDGKYEEWPEFKDLFQSLMKRYRGGDVEKLTHLKNYLRGEARNIIQHLGIKNGNYEIAWDLLTTQYENKNAIIDAHLKNLYEIPLIVHTSSQTIRHAVTVTRSCLAAINNMEILTETWDPLIVFLLKEKLNVELRSKWEEERGGSSTPATLKEFFDFLETRYKIISAFSVKRTSVRPNLPPEAKPRTVKMFVNQTSEPSITENKQIETTDADQLLETNDESDDERVLFSKHPETCGICSELHRVFKCPKITNNPANALQLIEAKHLCINCLYKHKVKDCTSKYTCRKCQAMHNTLLHEALVNESDTETIHHTQLRTQALLQTAIIPIYGTNNNIIFLRALIDPGSTTDLLTTRASQLLQCEKRRVNVALFGIGNQVTETAQYMATLNVGSLYDKQYRYNIDVLITREITRLKRISAESIESWEHLKGLELADPKHLDHENIDLLIGINTYTEIIETGLIKGKPNEPIAIKTKFGWIIAGGGNRKWTTHSVHTIACDNLANQIKAFWELEEISPQKLLSPAEQACEEYVGRTIGKRPDGKLVVRLPFNFDPKSPEFLGNSFENAKKRFLQLERRFERNPRMKEEYIKCIEEYIALGHAVEVFQICHLIPHHAVFKETSLTTKLRVVFDASAKTTNGVSLNQRTHSGPILLEEIWAVLLRWRLYKIAMISDIEKMYRQFWVHDEDTKFQQILWRTNPQSPFRVYELKTVTFGTTPAPYLAIRCLHFIADSVATTHPEMSRLIKKHFYVDDWLPSFDSVKQAIEMKNRISSLFQSYGLNLRKWNSNEKVLVQNNPLGETIELKVNPNETCSTLGLQWNTTDDSLSFRVAHKTAASYTKRSVLSEICSLFDPLGLLAPIIIRAKIFMQQLWLKSYGWDDKLPENLLTEWADLKGDLTECSNIKIPRWLGVRSRFTHVSLHGFSDASEKAYAAVIYVRTVDQDNQIRVNLITSKTRVAPLKSVSIPRLELCAALLVTKLLNKTKSALNIQFSEILAWTDSAITLAWITTPAYKLQTFVANRVSEIQNQMNPAYWRYINTKLNPADHASRGLFTKDLKKCSQWWHGPNFLLTEQSNWPTTPDKMISLKHLPETRTRVLTLKTRVEEHPMLLRYSSIMKLFRVTAYCLRWARGFRSFRGSSVILPGELINSRNIWIKIVQQQHYDREIQCLEKNQKLSNKSPILSLTPFLDKDRILRVQGRLRHAELADDVKHPAILPTEGFLTTLIIRNAHERAMHGGLQMTLRLIRESYWIIRGANVVRNHINKCVTCFRYRNQPMRQMMADLRPAQVQINYPFTHTGVDYAGYFETKSSTKRNAGYLKSYVCLFICLTTKAIHMEIAHDLSTNAFIMAFNRFISRRGIPTDIYSDRGTNFIGAATEMPRLWTIASSEANTLVCQRLTDNNIKWHFNPARASHFGGLWEAGVKSMKTHLYRVLGGTKLTFEGFTTIISQIEACLNSRPLCPISEDPEDLNVLTPGHFLIGRSLIAPPHPNTLTLPENRLSQYQMQQRLTQQFWTNWSGEYLHRLQQRPKWKHPITNLREGQCVLIKEDNLAPSQWVLGRIKRVFPGKDQLVRCAEVKCKNAVITRPIHKLCLLPIDDNVIPNELLSLLNRSFPGEYVNV